MNRKLFAFVAFGLLLAGCSEKTAKDLNDGISVEIDASQNIHHIRFMKYENGAEVASGNVINADSSPFEKGQVLIFDESLAVPNTETKVEFALSYSENLDGTNAKKTNRLDLSAADEWANLKLNQNYELQVIEMD